MHELVHFAQWVVQNGRLCGGLPFPGVKVRGRTAVGP